MLPNYLLNNLKMYINLQDIDYSFVETVHFEKIQPTSHDMILGCIIKI